MAYVSARYAPPDPNITTTPGAPKRVIATDEEGTEWFLTEDSQVGDWLRYVEEGGTIEPAPAGKSAQLPEPEIQRDVYAELDALEPRVAALEGKVP
jgi:hypothetical protein